MTRYEIYLISQYLESHDLDRFDVGNKNDYQKFINWVIERKRIGREYRKFVESHGIIFDSSNTAEIEKCYCDTLIAKDSPTYTITPFTNHMGGVKVKAKFMPKEGTPVIMLESRKVMLPYDITHIMTHNPYNIDQIYSWGKIHHNNFADITVGVFGKIYDCDQDEKMDQMAYLKGYMQGEYKDAYAKDNDSYFYFISSDRKDKTLEKRR
jgi:hypothetical protein